MASPIFSPLLTNGENIQNVTPLLVLAEFLILLGGDNFNCHPLNIEEDKRGVILLKSRLSDWHINFGPVNPSSITWLQSKNNINMVNVMSVSVVDIQEQLLLTILAEKYLDLSIREKLIQINKDNRIK